MEKLNQSFWEENVPRMKTSELLPEKYDMTVGYDFIFDENGKPYIVELNGKRSGLSGLTNIPIDPSASGFEKTKQIVDRVRGRLDYHLLDDAAEMKNYLDAHFPKDDGEQLPPLQVYEYLAVTLKILLHKILNEYPQKPEEYVTKAAIEHASLLVNFNELLRSEADKMFVHSTDMPRLIDFLVSDKFFFALIVPEEYRPKEFYEMTDAERERARGWVVKHHSGIQGNSITIYENTPEIRAQLGEAQQGVKAFWSSIQEYIEAAPAEEAAKAGNNARAALRFIEDVHVEGDALMVTYGGGYQRVGVGEAQDADDDPLDERIVNKSRGAKSYKMSKAETEKILPVMDRVNEEIVSLVQHLREVLESQA